MNMKDEIIKVLKDVYDAKEAIQVSGRIRSL